MSEINPTYCKTIKAGTFLDEGFGEAVRKWVAYVRVDKRVEAEFQ